MAPRRPAAPQPPVHCVHASICMVNHPKAMYKLNTKAKPRQNVHFLFRALRTHRRSRTRHRVSLPVERCTQWVPVSAPFNREAQ